MSRLAPQATRYHGDPAVPPGMFGPAAPIPAAGRPSWPIGASVGVRR